MHNFCFIISLLYSSTCFEHYALIIRRSKLYYTASGIITPCRWPSGAQVERGLLYWCICFLFCITPFDVLLTVHLTIILVINQINAQFLFYNKFIICLYMFRALCAHHQEVKIVLQNICYRHTCRWPSGAQSSLNLRTGRPPTGVMIPDDV